MDDELKRQIEAARPVMLRDASAIAFANKIVAVNGTRHVLSLPGRDISMVYYPAQDPAAPLIVGYHGGGFLFGGCALDDAMWTKVASLTGCNIASIGYRKSPDHKWRDCLADAYDSLLYLQANAEEFGFDADHISVMGQSAGANLAASCVLLAKRSQEIRIERQILVYPYLDLATEPDQKGTGSLNIVSSFVMNRLHIDPEDTKDPFASPLYAEADMLSELPDAVIVLAENDFLREEGLRYADMLRKASVSCVVRTYPAMPHGFFEVGLKDKITELDMKFLGVNGMELVHSGMLQAKAMHALVFISNHLKGTDK